MNVVKRLFLELPLDFIPKLFYIRDMQNKAYKFRLCPTATQETLLAKTLELCRWVYNETLGLRKTKWEQEHKSIGYSASNKFLPQWKLKKPELDEVYSQVLQDVQKRVDLAFQGFFRRIKAGEKPGYPRFKGFNRYDSFTFPQCSNGSVTLSDEGLHLSKIGTIEIILHREIPKNAMIKTATVKYEANQWYVVFGVEEPSKIIIANSVPKTIVGIDLGCKTFITLSNGKAVKNPKFLKQSSKRIAKAHRKLSKQPKGSKERNKAKKVLNKVYQKVNNQRRDFLHKVSRKLVNHYGTLVFEDLNIREMVEQRPWHSLNSAILDASWFSFVSMCSYKAVDAGRKVIKVNPVNTTKMCSKCGTIVLKALNIRIHNCPKCGLVMDRDLNAAKNILRRGQSSLTASKKAV